ncbi:MAG TPA: hypothetical protein VF185_00205 [Patescibacteria group bacterium]
MEDSGNSKEKPTSDFPKVEFLLNEELDVIKLDKFLTHEKRRGGANFKEMLPKTHPQLMGYEKLDPEDRLEKLKDYVHSYYQEHAQDLDNLVEKINKEWIDYSPQFFKVAGKIFKDMVWPEGEYKGYLTISPPYPRYLNTKTFQFSSDTTERGIRIASHELLHFIFYDYVRKRYLPDMTNTLEREMEEKLEGKFQIPLWELSEIFNIVVLSGDEWGKATTKQSASGYPHLKDYVPKFNELWEASGKDIDKLFTKLEVN